MDRPARGKKLLFLITEDWFFRSHFRDRGRAAQSEGYTVTVAARPGNDAAEIEADEFALAPIPFRRRGLNPFAEFRTFLRILTLYRRERPDLVHHIALKPILYGTLAARIAGIRAIVNAPVGMGFVFTSTTGLARLLRPFVHIALRLLLNPKGSRVVFENPEDRDEFVRSRLVRSEDTVLIPGAGVDLEVFRSHPEPPGTPVVTVAARMLESKGIREFVDAAALLKGKGISARFQLAGAPDPGNPESIPEQQLRDWHASGVVEWLGHRSDIADVYASAHIACLPSYREGLPKALLEAMASGLPVVSTDVVGCRFAVTGGETGLLVPARDAPSLAAALEQLIVDHGLRRRFGEAGRARAVREFGSPAIASQTISVYNALTESSG